MQPPSQLTPSTADGVPDDAVLLQGLVRMLGPDRTIEVLERERNIYTSSAPSEVITVRIDEGAPVRLFCKYFHHERTATDGRSAGPFNEVLTYRNVLGAPLTFAQVFGTWIDESLGEAWLVVEYLSGAQRLKHVVDQSAALEAASRWIGEFHLRNESRLLDPELTFLRKWDRAYFREQLDYALEKARSPRERPRWFARLQDRFDDVIDSLAGSPLTIVHAEYYPKNILVDRGRVFPIDWETASIAYGEIDVSMLLADWQPEMVDRCLGAYAETRQVSSSRIDWRRRLAAADVLVDVHWLAHSTASARSSNEDGKVVQWLRRLEISCAAFGIHAQ